MSVQTQLNRINSEVISQSTLIAQAIAALEGKAIGGGSSTPSEIQTCEVEINATNGDIYCSAIVYDSKKGYWEIMNNIGGQFYQGIVQCLPNSVISGSSYNSTITIDGIEYGNQFSFVIPAEVTKIYIHSSTGGP